MRTRPGNGSATSAAWGAALLVAGVWVVCLAAAFAAFRLSALLDEEGAPVNWTERLGQFGDTFGLVNALFTGLALMGLTYTVYLQREEMEEGRELLHRERREQFLSARLNAVVALHDARERHMAESRESFQSEDYYAQTLQSEADRLRQRIGFLRSEVRLGFDGEWTRDVMRRAVAMTMHDFVESERRGYARMRARYARQHADGLDPDAALKKHRDYLGDMRRHVRREFALLATQPEPECSDLADAVRPELDRWTACLDRTLAADAFRDDDLEPCFLALSARLAPA